jgi:hypothetical protein
MVIGAAIFLRHEDDVLRTFTVLIDVERAVTIYLRLDGAGRVLCGAGPSGEEGALAWDGVSFTLVPGRRGVARGLQLCSREAL